MEIRKEYVICSERDCQLPETHKCPHKQPHLRKRGTITEIDGKQLEDYRDSICNHRVCKYSPFGTPSCVFHSKRKFLPKTKPKNTEQIKIRDLNEQFS